MKEGSRPAMEFHLRDLLIACNEELLVKHLSLVQSEYPSVQLGSYPNTSKTYVFSYQTIHFHKYAIAIASRPHFLHFYFTVYIY